MPSLEHNALVELFRENPPLAPHLQVELAILSALVHGNSPEGLAVLRAAVTALKRLDPEHSAVYFQIIYAALRDPIRRAMEKLIMERQTNILDPLPPFLQ